MRILVQGALGVILAIAPAGAADPPPAPPGVDPAAWAAAADPVSRGRLVFEATDADDDAQLTAEEFAAASDAVLAARDANGDGGLDLGEFARPGPWVQRIFRDTDSDGDGRVSAEELRIRSAQMHQRMDRDGDGRMTFDEGLSLFNLR